MEWTGNDIDYIKNICYLGYFTEKEFYKGVKEQLGELHVK
jgi:hypothetical protein